ncbi:hypothetical protein INP83_03455 [Mucilaginibacter sp. 21P]|uniref:hypothetical protein n=1 Tax=Mucilaginibacter sp. 21P TaxID=2778902 RepID=UPI001C598C42|nr:hypothetical protein [Mucilaginibacter sp. 21P]QXV66161.1 hypothetical protein INP83_03455 [Mucilaginibacter sp. 21P]
MKKYYIPTLVMIVLFTSSCVQPTRNINITLKLHLKGMKDVQRVGVKGNDKPLSWDQGLPMTPIIKDSLYTVTYTLKTGYNFTEIKFTVDDKTELKGQPNRRLEFPNTNRVVYEAAFDNPGTKAK